MRDGLNATNALVIIMSYFNSLGGGRGGSEKVRKKHCLQSMKPFPVWYLQRTFSSGFEANFCYFSGLKGATQDLVLLKGSHE